MKGGFTNGRKVSLYLKQVFEALTGKSLGEMEVANKSGEKKEEKK